MSDTITRPRIHLIEAEADRLYELAEGLSRSQPALSELLLGEIERAELHDAGDLPQGVVSVGSRVAFVDETTGARREVSLVYPQHADLEAGRLSVLTHVGAGLLGLSEGQRIAWPDREGREHRLHVLKVTPAAEAVAAAAA
jgi:regulator of nucleoside diphosphate kinase